ncbi:uncharacterized protein Z519_00949 [Cladophialophora bantiana CBS 173.52]|uniref:Cytochrome P450 oxidoreductase n=1 Tax=Cladophialophora bantiana (strain ATCC 10958 / CBS 173.52 / CDC B-1940 / NIH 8579) TaxID=1442370 RepID=A0A0D2FAY6_CLAB1|nr:uncharacterized protein Z519_00949 [Cladophialophora bantiana CBS 173.52]KIW99286.1 hypothetical protein Z519_00949 [Cladophialophora bantiana CBS 173.52]
MGLPSNKLTALGVVLTAGWLVSKVVYALFFSPLRKIPGPFVARLTPLWLRFVDLAGNRTSTINRLHQRYGATVLIGPNEISLADISNVRELYGQGTSFMKAPVYESMTMPPNGVFSMRDKIQHSQRRRLLSHAFSQSNLQECEPLIQKQIENLLDVLRRNAGTPIDMLNWFRLTAFDVVGELFLGQSFGGLESGVTPQFLSDIEMFFILADLQWNNPWLARLILWIPLPSVRYFLGAMQRLADYGEQAFRRYVDQYGRSSGRRDLLTKILSAKAETGDNQLSDKETSLEIGNLIFAGTDTTSTTLTFLFWELSRNQTWQKRLREELLAHTDSSPTFQQIQDLPVLEAVINEALRLHPAAPASLPRETPVGGKELNGFFIPGKTIVSMQCYTTHRDPAVFPDPECFAPQRWVDPKKISYEMKELFMPFSKGTRACLGKNLAIMELKLITAHLARRFECVPAPSTTGESMATKDHFLLVPVGGKCELIFKEV